MKKIASPNVYSYIRFSSGEQRKGTGRRRQEKLAAEWCKARKLELATNYADLGMSAYKGRNATHGDLARFLACVESGKVRKGSILLVESLDRLSRQTVRKALQLFLQIIEGGVTVVTLCDGKEFSPERCELPELMMSLVIFARANDESMMKSQRKAASWQKKRDQAREGKPLGGRPPSWIESTDEGYKIIEQNAARVRAVFADYVAGSGIWKLYQKHKLPRATVGFWLNSPAVIGDLVITEKGGTETIKGYYPPIVSAATWHKAQQLRTERFINRRRGAKGKPNLFAGILFDAKGQRFNVANIGGRRLLVCPGCVIGAEQFENAMVDHALRQNFIRTRHEEKNEPAAAEQKLREKLAGLQAIVAGEADMTTIQALMPAIRETSRKLKAAEGDRVSTVTECVSYDLVASLLNGGGTDDDRLAAREIIRETVKKIVVEASSNAANIKLIRVAVHMTARPDKPYRFSLVTVRGRRGWLMLGGDDVVSVMVPTGERVPRDIPMDLKPDSLKRVTPELAAMSRLILPKTTAAYWSSTELTA